MGTVHWVRIDSPFSVAELAGDEVVVVGVDRLHDLPFPEQSAHTFREDGQQASIYPDAWASSGVRREFGDASSQSPMEATKPARKHDRHCHDTHPKNDHVLGVPQVELPHAVHEQVTDGQVQETPQDVDR